MTSADYGEQILLVILFFWAFFALLAVGSTFIKKPPH
jgi:hypothetical protein